MKRRGSEGLVKEGTVWGGYFVVPEAKEKTLVVSTR